MPKRKRNGGNAADDVESGGKAITVRGKVVSYARSSMPATIQKYWRKTYLKINRSPLTDIDQRYRLFSKYDEGIWMDEESWYSVTPEPIALQIAHEVSSCGVNTIVDGFCGAGGNAIAFALQSLEKVYAWDVNPVKIEVWQCVPAHEED